VCYADIGNIGSVVIYWSNASLKTAKKRTKYFRFCYSKFCISGDWSWIKGN